MKKYVCVLFIFVSLVAQATPVTLEITHDGSDRDCLLAGGQKRYTATVRKDNIITGDVVKISALDDKGNAYGPASVPGQASLDISMGISGIVTIQASTVVNGVTYTQMARYYVFELKVEPTELFVCKDEVSEKIVVTINPILGGDTATVSQSSVEGSVVISNSSLYLSGGGGNDFTVTGGSGGTVTLTITQDQSPNCTVTVIVHVIEVTIDVDEDPACKYENVTFTATVKPDGGTVTWLGGDESDNTTGNTYVARFITGGSRVVLAVVDFMGHTCIASKTVTIADITITSISPDPLRLGTDLLIRYDIGPAGFNFGSVELEIENKNGAIVFKKGGSPPTAGSHQTTWENAKWNQGANSGAYANPNNGPYTVKITGTHNGRKCPPATQTLNTILEVQFEIEDPAGTANVDDRAGIAIDPHTLTAFKGGTTWFLNFTISPGANHTEAKFESKDAALNQLDDGVWTIELKDFRDDIGNFTQISSDKSFRLHLR